MQKPLHLGRALIMGQLALVVTALGPRASELTTNYSYSDYVKHYRVIASDEGKLIFDAKLKEVLAHNAKASPGSSYKKGINAFTHSALGPAKGRVAPPRAWLDEHKSRYREPFPTDLILAPFAGTSGFPASMDWSAYDTPVKEQGGCGGCWAFTSTQLVESYLAIGAGLKVDLSVQQFVACSANEADCGGYGGCMGSVPEFAFEYLAESTNASSGGGLLTEFKLGYSSYFGMGNGTQTMVYGDDNFDTPAINESTCDYIVPALIGSGAGLVVGARGYVKLPENNATAVMAALATVGPLAVNVDASGWVSE